MNMQIADNRNGDFNSRNNVFELIKKMLLNENITSIIIRILLISSCLASILFFPAILISVIKFL